MMRRSTRPPALAQLEGICVQQGSSRSPLANQLANQSPSPTNRGTCEQTPVELFEPGSPAVMVSGQRFGLQDFVELGEQMSCAIERAERLDVRHHRNVDVDADIEEIEQDINDLQEEFEGMAGLLEDLSRDDVTLHSEVPHAIPSPQTPRSLYSVAHTDSLQIMWRSQEYEKNLRDN